MDPRPDHTTPISLEFAALQDAVAGRFSLVREIGRGGMGIVFLARDASLERLVAIKLLPPHLAEDATLRERFLREARTAARLMHPNIVPIHAVEERGALLFFVMAFVDGQTLAERVRRDGPLPSDAVVRLMQELSWALAYAHAQGIVHRDIKPDNVLLERASGRALIADFGIAHATADETLGAPGTLIGTVQYMSPEQATGETLDGRSDLYSFGATIYFAATGRPPFDGPSLPAVLGRLVSEAPPRIADARTDLAPIVAETVSRCLNKRPTDRFSSAEEVAVAVGSATSAARALPPSIKSLVRDLGQFRLVGFVGIAALAGSATVWWNGTASIDVVQAIAGVGATLVLIAMIVAPLGYLLEIRRSNIPWDELDDALGAELTTLIAERNAAEKQWTPREYWANRTVSGASALLSLFGATAFLRAWLALPTPGRPALFLYSSIGMAVAAVVLAVGALRIRRDRPITSWLRFGFRPGGLITALRRVLRSRTFRRLFANVGRQENPVAADVAGVAPTATLLLRRVDELFAALPNDVRKRLRHLPAVSSRLERAIIGLRERIATLDSAIAEIGPGGPGREEFVAARESAAERLATAIAALETLRMDLLRLQTGLAGADGITADLARASAIGETIDAELRGTDDERRLSDARPGPAVRR